MLTGMCLVMLLFETVLSLRAYVPYNGYICFWNFMFLNHVIINKTKVLFPEVEVILVDVGYPA